MANASPRESPEPDGPRKRRRTVLACNECREKKRKCDGVKPVCGACGRRSISECVWDEERSNKTWNSRYIDTLKARIRELESQQERPSPHPDRQHESPVFPLEAAPPSYPDIDPTPLQIHAETARGTTHNACLPSPSNQPQLQNEQSARTADGVSNPTYDVPDWSLGVSLPINNQLLSPINEDESEGAGTDNEDDKVDAMGIISGFPAPNSGSKRRRASNYFGPSSSKGLLDKARNAMDKGRRMSISDTSTSPSFSQGRAIHHISGDVPAKSRGPRRDGGVFGMVLPSRSEADGLIESYWRWTHSLYPFIHRPSFEMRYLTIWYPPIRPENSESCPDSSKENGIYAAMSDRLFYCMLNTLFALGAHFSPKIDHKDRAAVSHSFYERAKTLLDIDLLADGSLALVQTLLLMGQYLQSTEMSNSCWNIVGLAVRVAQCIGLHHDTQRCDQGCCSAQSLDQVEIEMRRRAWTGCVMLDRVLSLAYGRPLMVHSMISQCQLMLPSPIDDQYLSQSPNAAGSQPEGMPSFVDCYIQAVQLQEILGQVLTSFYYGNPHGRQDQGMSDSGSNSAKGSVKNNGAGSTDLQRMLNVDKLLVAWHNKLPAHLKIETYETNPDLGLVDSERQAVFHRQSTVLELRFLHTRLMMLRTVLPIVSDPENQNNPLSNSLDAASIGSNIEQDMLLKTRATCVDAAQKLLRIIESNIYVTESLLPPPWYTVYYIHSCAVVFLTALLYPPNRTDSTEEAGLLPAFNRCLEALRVYKSQSRTARRCSRSLSSIKQEVFRNLNMNMAEQGYGVDGNTQTAPVGDNGDLMNIGLGYSRPGLTGRKEDLLSASALLNDDRFQYALMSDLSLFSQNAFDETAF